MLVVDDTFRPALLPRCRELFEGGYYAESVARSFRVVRERLRELTGSEKASDAFGKGGIRVAGAAADHVDDDFQEGVRFLMMAIDRFRNEKAHTVDGNINDPVRAYEYLRLSSLALRFLDAANSTEQVTASA